MKLTDVIIHESPFTPRNFPAEPNKKFTGAGERTVYSDLPANQPGGNGFRVMRLTTVVRGKGNISELPPNTRIFWTFPAKLFTAAELGEKGVSNYAMFGIKSAMPKDAVGFIPISAVEKPSKMPGRVLTGKAGQEEVYKALVNAYSDRFDVIEQIHTAGIGSRKADLIVTFDDTQVQFEIKNASSQSAPVTLFDKTVRRGRPNEVIDGLVSVMTGRVRMNLEKAVDQVRQKDKTFGFPGDKGVGKSGKFVLRITDDNDLIIPAHDFIVDHFAENGDNYLAINYGNDKMKLYFTGLGRNILRAPRLPIPKYIDLRTYGGPTGGGMRLGVKIKL